MLEDPDLALLDLLRRLEAEGYDFIPPTPLTHARVLARPDRRQGRSLRDILGWSLRFEADDAPAGLVAALAAAGVLGRAGGLLRSEIRVARLHGRLFIHSAYPTDACDAVFLGPDSYRFAAFIARELGGFERGRIVDVGGGCGVGAIVAGDVAPAAELFLTDINPLALRFARINAAHAGMAVGLLEADGLAQAPGDLQLVVANPPYIAASGRTYSDGGDMHGARISLEWARAALMRLAPGGRLLLYTGSAILDGGRDALREALTALARDHQAALDYREIDPDVFGEELETEPYRDVERIAVVTCVITARGAAPLG